MPLCAPYPGPLSVLVMDNARIHHGDEILELADRFGVQIEYLPPYSPDLNPIEEAFSQVKAFIRCHNDIFLSGSPEDIMFDMIQAFDIV
jgi:transposase